MVSDGNIGAYFDSIVFISGIDVFFAMLLNLEFSIYHFVRKYVLANGRRVFLFIFLFQ